jgi:hypothetical protein
MVLRWRSRRWRTCKSVSVGCSAPSKYSVTSVHTVSRGHAMAVALDDTLEPGRADWGDGWVGAYHCIAGGSGTGVFGNTACRSAASTEAAEGVAKET